MMQKGNRGIIMDGGIPTKNQQGFGNYYPNQKKEEKKKKVEGMAIDLLPTLPSVAPHSCISTFLLIENMVFCDIVQNDNKCPM